MWWARQQLKWAEEDALTAMRVREEWLNNPIHMGTYELRLRGVWVPYTKYRAKRNK